MAYSDYGAFVYKNGERRRDKEDVALFKSDEETFGESSENIPSGARIWVFLAKHGGGLPWTDCIHHGIMGDGDIRVMCHKTGFPRIYERIGEDINDIDYHPMPDNFDAPEGSPIYYEYKGYKFIFKVGEPNIAEMIEPDGTYWRCEYGYLYGAGFEGNKDA